MRYGPKYKIARRLGAPIFEKTQTQKYALAESRKKKPRRGRAKSDYGLQLIEKQKVRFSYLLPEKQLRRYVEDAQKERQGKTTEALFRRLESRLDNAVYRAGFAPTRGAARQMVGHGHITVNGRVLDIPSHGLREKDVLGIRKQSADKGLFAGLDERIGSAGRPNWLKYEPKQREATVSGAPKLEEADVLFDLSTVLDFYSR